MQLFSLLFLLTQFEEEYRLENTSNTRPFYWFFIYLLINFTAIINYKFLMVYIFFNLKQYIPLGKLLN